MSSLNRDEQKWLLGWARQVVAAAAAGTPVETGDEAAPETLRQPGAAFVTLHKRGELRGCVGLPLAQKPLYLTVAEAALSAARHDPRFPPVESAEVPELDIEISVLSPLAPIQPEQVIPGEHGLLVTDGFHRGLLLPQVAREHGWTRERFLEETCVKAGLDRTAWQRGAKLEAFTAEVFSEETCAEPQPADRRK